MTPYYLQHTPATSPQVWTIYERSTGRPVVAFAQARAANRHLNQMNTQARKES